MAENTALETTIVAIHTYGKERVKDARSKTWVSAYKVGHTSAASQALLFALDTKRVRGISTPTATYNYFEVTGDFVSKGGYLVFQLTAAQVAKAEEATRRHLWSQVYVWQEGAWWEFPTKDAPDYTATTGRTAPTFDPLPLFAAEEEKAASAGIVTVERSDKEGSSVWWWLGGDTYPHRELLKAHGARWSAKRKQWYYMGPTLPDTIQQLAVNNVTFPPMPPELAAQIEQVLEHDQRAEQSQLAPADQANTTAPKGQAHPEPSRTDKPAVRVIPPPFASGNGQADPVQIAVEGMKAGLLTPSAPTISTQTFGPAIKRGGSLRRITQRYCGELTGSVSGDVHCYGWAVHDGVCVYLNFGGPRMAVEAMRARLGKGEQVSLVPPDAPAIELTAGEGNTGMYRDHFANIAEARFTSLILLHEWVVAPNYGGAAVTFLFRTDDAQAKTKVRHHVTQLVAVAVFEVWSEYLWQAGWAAGLIATTLSSEVDLLTLFLDATAWTRLIAGGLEQGVIHLPIPNTEPTS